MTIGPLGIEILQGSYTVRHSDGFNQKHKFLDLVKAIFIEQD